MKVLTDEARAKLDAALPATFLFLAGAITSASVGLLSGWLTGQSGPDPTVTAAAIPAILSAVGAFAFLKGMMDGKPLNYLGATLFVVVFCVSFFVALHSGVDTRVSEEYKNLKEADELHLRHLQACSQAEAFLNEARAVSGLGPLSIGHFCRKIQ